MALRARRSRLTAGRHAAGAREAPGAVSDAEPPAPPPPPPPPPPLPPQTQTPAAPVVSAENGHVAARLGELLVQAGSISSADLAEALVQQPHAGGKRIGRILVDAGALDERQL